MAYASGTVTSTSALVDAIRAFLTSNGSWVEERHTESSGDTITVFSHPSVDVFWYVFGADTSSAPGTPFRGRISRTHDATVGIGDTGDVPDGPYEQGETSGIRVGDELPESGNWVEYHLFHHADPDRFYMVLEAEPGMFFHWGFGLNIEKFGTWSRGEYMLMFRAANGSGGNTPNNLTHAGHSMLWDGGQFARVNAPAMHIDGSEFPGISNDAEWAMLTRSPGFSGSWHDDIFEYKDYNGNDRATFLSGPLSGIFGSHLNYIPTSTAQGFIPMLPIPIFHYNDSIPAVYYLGRAPHIRYVNMEAFEPGAEVSFGNETWKIFPFLRKDSLDVASRHSDHMGFAYLKE